MLIMMMGGATYFRFLLILSAALCASSSAHSQQQPQRHRNLNEKSQEAFEYWNTHGGFETAEPFDMAEIHLDENGGLGTRSLLRGSTGSRLLVEEEEVPDGDYNKTETPVMHAAGRLFFVMHGKNKVCSATAVTDETTGRSIAITAGHCAYDEDNKTFAEYSIFIPMQDDGGTDKTNFDCTDDEYGCWVVDFAVVQDCWADNVWPDNMHCDWAYLVFPDTGAHLHHDDSNVPQALDQAVPTLEVNFTGINDCENDHGVMMGYSKKEDPHFRYCHVHQMTPDPVYGYMLPGCELTGGSSGGPGMRGCNLGYGPITHVVSWGATYPNGDKVMGGPVLGDTLAECGFAMAKGIDFHLIANSAGIVIESDGTNGCQVRAGYLLPDTSAPTSSPITSSPTSSPTTSAPTSSPTSSPTSAPQEQEATTPPPPPSELLLWDDGFEQDFGHWNDGGVDVERVETQRWDQRPNWQTEVQPVMGGWAIRLRDDTYIKASLTSNVISPTNTPELIGRSKLRLEFDYVVESFEAQESFFVEVCEGGLTTFCPDVDGFQRVQFTNDVHFIDNGANNNGPPALDHYFDTSVEFDIPPSDFIIRFRCKANNDWDRLYIGGVRVYTLV